LKYFDQKQPEISNKRLVKRLEGMGYQVTLEPQSPQPPDGRSISSQNRCYTCTTEPGSYKLHHALMKSLFLL